MHGGDIKIRTETQARDRKASPTEEATWKETIKKKFFKQKKEAFVAGNYSGRKPCAERTGPAMRKARGHTG